MSGLWMPGARRDGRNWVAYGLNGAGGSIRVALHTTENAQGARLDGIADYMWNNAGPGTGYSLLYHPTTGDLLQLRAADVGAGSLKNLSGGVETNRNGLVNLQISVCAYAGERWDELYPCPRWPDVVAWVRSLGVPDRYVSEPFTSGRATMSTGQWTGPDHGWYGHQHAPENDHTDPGPRADPWTIGGTAPVDEEEDDMPKPWVVNSNGSLWISDLATYKTWIPDGAIIEEGKILGAYNLFANAELLGAGWGRLIERLPRIDVEPAS